LFTALLGAVVRSILHDVPEMTEMERTS